MFGERVQLPVSKGLGKFGCLRRHGYRVGRNLDCLPRFADLQVHVDPRDSARVHQNAGVQRFLETRLVRFDSIRPGIRKLMVYSPSSRLGAVVTTPVSSFTARTAAPGTAPPLASTTAPEIRPVFTCAAACGVRARKTITNTVKYGAKFRNVKLFICFYQPVRGMTGNLSTVSKTTPEATSGQETGWPSSRYLDNFPELPLEAPGETGSSLCFRSTVSYAHHPGCNGRTDHSLRVLGSRFTRVSRKRSRVKAGLFTARIPTRATGTCSSAARRDAVAEYHEHARIQRDRRTIFARRKEVAVPANPARYKDPPRYLGRRGPARDRER